MSFSNYTGMSDIPRISCKDLNNAISDRVLALHGVCRKH